MSYEVEVLAHSSAGGEVLITLLIDMPRFILAEFNTHRMFSRNSASSRAIPVEKRIAMLQTDPFIPEAFLANKKGMQAGDTLDPIAQAQARQIWLEACASATKHAKRLADVGVHKQWANRIIEPYAWHKVICSATEWRNFLALREHPAAQPEIQIVAKNVREAIEKSTPIPRCVGDLHAPYIRPEDIEEAYKYDDRGVDLFLLKCSVARCARVSYLTHDRNVIDYKADHALHDMLLTNGHMSPFEHQAFVIDPSDPEAKFGYGNFAAPFQQYRKRIPNEQIFTGGQ